MTVDKSQWLPMLVDQFEPTGDIVPLLEQSIPVQVTANAFQGFADYLFTAVDFHSIQIERKQNGELLTSLASVEEQLRRQYPKADENHLIVEGFITASRIGCMTWKRSGDGRYFHMHREYEYVSYAGWLSWCYSLDKAGITVHTTPDLRGTASLLVAMYTNAQMKEHTTLNRYIKDKVILKEQNHQVYNLMGLRGADCKTIGLGEDRARALIEVFGTVWNVALAAPEDLMKVPGIGRKLAFDTLRAIGRNV